MENVSKKTNFIIFIIAYAITRFIFKLFNFNYSIATDGFANIKFIIDFGLWIIVYVLIYGVLKKMGYYKQ